MATKFIDKSNGNVKRIGKVLTQVKNDYKNVGNSIVDSNAQIFYNALIDNIEHQKIDWTPLNPKYKEHKGVLGLDTRILIATGEYLSNIKIRKVYKTGDTVKRHVGVDSRTKHKDSNLKMSDLAIIMEYGTSDGRVPARSHYGTTWEQILPDIRRNTLAKARSMFRY